MLRIGPYLTLSHGTQSIMNIDIPHHLSDEELEAQLKSLARGEQEATARLISHLAEFDALTTPYMEDNIVRQDYLMTRAIKA